MSLSDMPGDDAAVEMTDPLTLAVAERDWSVVSMVEDALRARRVRLAFQPVLPARGALGARFHEGLARILDPAGRVIPARDFMPVVETREIGRVIDCVALELGLDALARNGDLRLSVNMSARSIGYARWIRTLESALARDGSIAGRLILEITEASAMLVPDIVQAFMDDLQLRGIAFALDDFGAGYTAFRYLRDFHFDILKIDGQFIRGIADAPDNQVLTAALISIGKHFDMVTIAESVETAVEAQWLTEAGIDCMQGHHFGAPTLSPDWGGPARTTSPA